MADAPFLGPAATEAGFLGINAAGAAPVSDGPIGPPQKLGRFGGRVPILHCTLAEKLLQTQSDEDAREAQTQLMRLWATADDPAYAAKAVEALARLMIRRGMLEDAVGLYSQLGTKYAGVVVRDGKTGADIYGELITDKRLLPYLEQSSVYNLWKLDYSASRQVPEAYQQQIKMYLCPGRPPAVLSVGDFVAAGGGLTDEDLDELEHPRHALHAARLALTHPITRAPLVIEAPLPQDLVELWTRLVS